MQSRIAQTLANILPHKTAADRLDILRKFHGRVRRITNLAI